VLREVIHALHAWDAETRARVTLPPGSVVESCQIRRTSRVEREAGVEAYLMEFHSLGRQFRCPLFHFQPRTQAVSPVLENLPAREAATI